MKTVDIEQLNKKAALIRYYVTKMIGANKKGHFGGSLSVADILSAIYFYKMNYDPKNPKWDGRDRFFLSKGHASYAQYAALAILGVFPENELYKAKQVGSMLQGHPDMNKTPGVEGNTGSLAQGISLAAGCAQGLKLDGSNSKVFVVLGDGEIAEGQVWEAATAASCFELDNLVGVLDNNGLESTGVIAERHCIGDIKAKWQAFGWHTIEVDGHDMQQLVNALDASDEIDKPVMIIANTIKGKGISLAENVAAFHNGMMNSEDFDAAIEQLESQL
ncbi:MAG: transketolase [Clostridia bacterium]|jgi:transketolase|nr:transketolase [Clostridia bacterium]